MKLRNPEAKRDDDSAPGRRRDLLKMHDAEHARKDRAGDDAEQHRYVGDEAGAPFDQAEDDQQDE